MDDKIDFNNMNIKDILKQLDDGIQKVFNGEETGNDKLTADNYKSFLRQMSNFHNYSSRNSLLIHLQNPYATLTTGFKTWQKLGRQVKKGEKGLSILAPTPYKEKMINPQTNEEVEIEKITFRTVKTFDVSQTEGKELVKRGLELIGDDIPEKDTIIKSLEELVNIKIEFKDLYDGSKGYYAQFTDGTEYIAINIGMSDLQTLKTLIHEVSHVLLHKSVVTERNKAEIEAESVAFVVCSKLGLDTSQYSFKYVANWSKEKDTTELKKCLDNIQKTSKLVIDHIEKSLGKSLSIEKEVEKIYQEEKTTGKNKDDKEQKAKTDKSKSNKTKTTNKVR